MDVWSQYQEANSPAHLSSFICRVHSLVVHVHINCNQAMRAMQSKEKQSLLGIAARFRLYVG
jgi:hypothetical protein